MSDDQVPERPRGTLEPVRTHREVGAILGIGRARVFYLEKQALQKLRDTLSEIGVRCLGDLESLLDSEFREIEQRITGPGEDPLPDRFAPQHGWLKVERIVSINEGSESIADIVMAFVLLKERNEKLFRPPVVVKSSRGIRVEYLVQAVASYGESLHVRCWPKGHRRRSVTHLTEKRCTALVDSERGVDEHGEFDIPVLSCVIVSG